MRGIGSASSAPVWQSAAESVPPFLPPDPQTLGPVAAPRRRSDYWDARSDLADCSGTEGSTPERRRPRSSGCRTRSYRGSSAATDYSTAFAVNKNSYQINCMADDLAEAESLALAVRKAFHLPAGIRGRQLRILSWRRYPLDVGSASGLEV